MNLHICYEWIILSSCPQVSIGCKNKLVCTEFCRKNAGEVSVVVVYSVLLQSINAIIGWIYFAAWSVSFYPQVNYV